MMNRRGWRGGEFGAARQMRQGEVSGYRGPSEVPSSTSASPPHHLTHARDITILGFIRRSPHRRSIAHAICSPFGSIRCLGIGASTHLQARLHIRANPRSALELDSIHHQRRFASTAHIWIRTTILIVISHRPESNCTRTARRQMSPWPLS